MNRQAEIRIDWSGLLSKAKELDRPLTDEELALWKRGLIDGNARMWNVEYVHAAERAARGNMEDRNQLYAMMRAEIPIPSFLLPIVAALDARGGRPAAFTAWDDALIRQELEIMCRLGGHPPAVKKEIAQRRGVDVAQIHRSLRRTASGRG